MEGLDAERQRTHDDDDDDDTSIRLHFSNSLLFSTYNI